jgi:hypothetical protein
MQNHMNATVKSAADGPGNLVEGVHDGLRKTVNATGDTGDKAAE